MMTQSELNKELEEAIKEAIIPHHLYDFAANECERICLQKQIELLEKVKYGLIQKGVINEYIKEIQEQLNQLNNK